jgi:hypothetical protein
VQRCETPLGSIVKHSCGPRYVTLHTEIPAFAADRANSRVSSTGQLKRAISFLLTELAGRRAVLCLVTHLSPHSCDCLMARTPD